MTQLNEEHFELHDQNKDERYQRQRVMKVEDKIKTIKLKTFLKRVNHTLRNENQIYFALKDNAIKSRKENQS